MKHKYFDCICHDPDHILRVSYLTNDAGKISTEETIYLEIQLESGGFFKRLIRATKYLFGYKVKEGMWTSAELNKEKTKELNNLLTEYLLSFDINKRLQAKIDEIKEKSKD